MVEFNKKDEKCDLDSFKKKYEVLRKKYSLPEFAEMSQDFNIERASDIETDYILREVRKFVSDKIFNYLRFIEALLNPSNVPMYIFSIVKALSLDDKKKLSEIYSELAKMEVVIMDLDLNFSEKKEVEFLNNSFKAWQKIKKELSLVVDSINLNWDIKSDSEKKGYFG